MIKSIPYKIGLFLNSKSNNNKLCKLIYLFLYHSYQLLKLLVTFQFKKILDYINNQLNYIKNKNKVKKDFSNLFDELINDVKDKDVIILPPTIDWNKPLFQRPQQLAKAYSQHENFVVFYLTKNSENDTVETYEKIQSNCWLINDNLTDSLNKVLEGAKTVTISISWTVNKTYLQRIKHTRFIYEYIDELDIFCYYGPEMEEDHAKFLNHSDLVVCTATKLYDQVMIKNPKSPVILSTNAGDYDFFSKTNEYEINNMIVEEIKNYDLVLGYYGALANWFDYDLVKKVAIKCPNWIWVLVGLDYDGTLEKSGILGLDNVIYIPAQPYETLPSFLKAFDIATIPFVINEITLSTSPVKIFEYMAANKPIISSKMPECLKYNSVKIYNSDDEFIELAKELSSYSFSNEYYEILKQEAKSNTWFAKTEEILKKLG